MFVLSLDLGDSHQFTFGPSNLWDLQQQKKKKELEEKEGLARCLATSVTRLGDLLDFGQLFKAFDNN